jgi:tetratricopeptide (TPR) repeat protein
VDGGSLFLVRDRAAWRVRAAATEAGELGLLALELEAGGRSESARRVAGWARDEAMRLVSAADPSLLPFGVGALAADEDPLRVAAVLASSSRDPAAALAALDREVARAPLGSGDASHVGVIQAARGGALLAVGRYEEALEVARALLSAAPASPPGIALQAHALDALGRRDEVHAALHQARDLRSASARRTAAEVALQKGYVEEAAALYEQLLSGPDGKPGDANNLAWARLFMDAPATAAISDAQRGARGAESHATLHTLAAVLARAGEAGQAIRVLRHAVDQNGHEATPDDQVVVGLVAEAYGLPDAAAAAFARVERKPAGQERPTSCWSLAQRRLEALAAAGSPPGAPARSSPPSPVPPEAGRPRATPAR